MITKPIGMNTLIAEHVFGWKWDKHWAGGCWIIPKQYRDWDCGEPQVTPPNFTEDIADAWQVVEKLRELRANEKPYNGIVIQTFPTQGWSVLVAGTIVYSDSLPEAICLAALKVVGVEVSSPK